MNLVGETFISDHRFQEFRIQMGLITVEITCLCSIMSWLQLRAKIIWRLFTLMFDAWDDSKTRFTQDWWPEHLPTASPCDLDFLKHYAVSILSGSVLKEASRKQVFQEKPTKATGLFMTQPQKSYTYLSTILYWLNQS